MWIRGFHFFSYGGNKYGRCVEYMCMCVCVCACGAFDIEEDGWWSRVLHTPHVWRGSVVVGRCEGERDGVGCEEGEAGIVHGGKLA